MALANQCVELAQITSHALLKLSSASLHLRSREVLVAAVNRLELAAVDGHAGFRQQPHLSAQLDEAGADLADRRTIVLAEVGNRLVIRNKAAQEPQHLQVATGLALQLTARLNSVEIAIDVQLQ